MEVCENSYFDYLDDLLDRSQLCYDSEYARFVDDYFDGKITLKSFLYNLSEFRKNWAMACYHHYDVDYDEINSQQITNRLHFITSELIRRYHIQCCTYSVFLDSLSRVIRACDDLSPITDENRIAIENIIVEAESNNLVVIEDIQHFDKLLGVILNLGLQDAYVKITDLYEKSPCWSEYIKCVCNHNPGDISGYYENYYRRL